MINNSEQPFFKRVEMSFQESSFCVDRNDISFVDN